MKASKIIAAIQETDEYLRGICRVPSPRPDVDVTDFGLGEFDQIGLVAHVLTNCPKYCSKWLVLQEGQFCPNHYHPSKQEDIACEAGRIMIRLYGVADVNQPPELFADRRMVIPGVLYNNTVFAGGAPEEGTEYILEAGMRIQLPPGLWHEFWAVDGPALAVEVSTVNNDVGDNVFADERIGRFVTEIEQDVPGKIVRLNDRGFIEVVEG